MTGKAKVSLGYLHPGEVTACFHESLIDLMFYDAMMYNRLGHPYGKMGKRAGSGGIVDGRNQLTRLMLHEGRADWLWMVDSDMGFAPDTLERLIDSAHAKDRPIVGALCFAYAQDGKADFFGARWRATPTLYDWFEDDDKVGFVPRLAYEREALQVVGATGAACTLIHRKALQAIEEKFGQEWWEPIHHPKGQKFSEDLSFCIRAAACDIPVHVHTGVKTTHNKGAIYFDEEWFIAQQEIRELCGMPQPSM